MLKTIKLDLITILRDKLFIVMASIVLGISLLNPLIYKGLAIWAANIEGLGGQLMVNAKAFAFLSFAMSGGASLVVMVFLPIIVYKQYSNGIVRNKIIYGRSRTEIYFSLLISMFVVAFAVLFVSSMAAFALSLTLFPYSSAEVNVGDEIAGFFVSLFFEMLIVFFEVSLTAMFVVGLKSVALSIVIPVAGASIFSLLGSIVATTAPGSTLEQVVRYVDVYYLAEHIAITKYELGTFIALFITPVCYAALFTVLGWIIFKKKDIK